MLGTGKSLVVNEASNYKANQNLTATIEQMGSREYQKGRDLTDVIPTHRRAAAAVTRDNGVPVFDPAAEKIATRMERGGEVLDEDDEDMEFMELRRMRMAQLKIQHEREALWRSKQHGEYREISQDDFFNVVVRERGGSDQCCVHFYHKDFESCRLMDSRLSDLAKMMLPVKFVKVDAEKSPFLVERLHVTTLPCLLLFKNDVCIDRILGFEDCADEDGVLDLDLLRERVEQTMSYNLATEGTVPPE